MKLTTGRLLIVAVVALMGMFLLQLFGPNPSIIVSPQTTYLTAPLAADGLPDYAKYLLDEQRVGVTPETNAAIPFLQAMWPAELDPEHQQIVCDEIGMEVPEADGLIAPTSMAVQAAGPKGDLIREVVLLLMAKQGIVPREGTLIDSAAAYREWGSQVALDSDAETTGIDGDPFEEQAKLLLNQCQERPWTSEQVPPLAKWLQRNEDKFELLHKAALRPEYYCPSPTLLIDPNANLYYSLIGDVTPLRHAVRTLSIRSMYNLGEKQYAAAWNNCRVMHQLAAHFSRKTLIGQLIQIACHRIADRAVMQLLNEPQLPVATAAQIQDYFLTIPVTQSMVNAIDNERFSIITAIVEYSGQRVASDTFSDSEGIEQYSQGLSVDWNQVLESINGWYDKLNSSLALKNYSQRARALEQFEAKLSRITPNPRLLSPGFISRVSRSKRMANKFAGLMMPAILPAFVAEDRHHSNTQLMQMATTLALYRVTEGSYPASLKDLIPKYVPKYPTDLYTGAPLAYTKTDNGYLLVDLGPNGINEGGMNEMRSLYRGYEVSGNNDRENRDTAIRSLLGEPIPAESEDEIGLEMPSGFDMRMSMDMSMGINEEGGVPYFLEDAIPPGSDDNAIRMPPIPVDWSALE